MKIYPRHHHSHTVRARDHPVKFLKPSKKILILVLCLARKCEILTLLFEEIHNTSWLWDQNNKKKLEIL